MTPVLDLDAPMGRETQPSPVQRTAPVTVLVVWDGTMQTATPPELVVPVGSLVTMPAGSLAGSEGHDWLLDGLTQRTTEGPTVVVGWRGLPAALLRQISLMTRLQGRDQVARLPTAPTPLAALSVGWRLARLVQARPLDVRHARALGLALAAETRSAALLPRPNRARLLELGGVDLVRGLRSGRKVVRWQPHPVVSHLAPGAPLLDTGPPGPGPRLAIVTRGVDAPRPDLGTGPADVVVEMHPGSLDADAWGQRGYAEVAVTPRGVDHLVPALDERQFCRSCERLRAVRQATCDWCTLRS